MPQWSNTTAAPPQPRGANARTVQQYLKTKESQSTLSLTEMEKITFLSRVRERN